MLKHFPKLIADKSKLLTATLAALFMVAIVPNLARADAISDAVTDFDTSNIFAAGAAIIGLIIAIVDIRAVMKLLRGAA